MCGLKPKNWLPFGAGLLLSMMGCAVGPDYEKPELELPQSWNQQQQEQNNAALGEIKDWWAVLNDPVLESLIERSANANLDLREALLRIEESRALRDFSTGRY
ncbi:MAG: hypothetical protein ACYS19_05390 [Planctomycetota bacterium]|jgi:multidrug efflux system outer membrane protein